MACPILARRRFLKGAGALLLAPALPAATLACAVPPPDLSLRIRPARVELAPGHVITTTTYNGQFPGPIIRSSVGRRTIIDVRNESAATEHIQWQGQHCTEDAGVPVGGDGRFQFTAARRGLSFYRSDVIAAADLSTGAYSGQTGLIFVEPCNHPGDFDREVFLVLQAFRPHLQRMRDGCEVGYELFTVNGRMLGHGEPVTVNAGERVLFHVLNASATQTHRLALPGHTFRVLTLDGNPVPTPALVSSLQLAPAESVSAVVEMSRPGVWILGELADDYRSHGMGIVVEYAGRAGAPEWHTPTHTPWSYTRFGGVRERAQPVGSSVDLVIARNDATRGGFKRWSLNGACPGDGAAPSLRLRPGDRYRLRIRNASPDHCPLELRDQVLEVTAVAGQPTGGLLKEVVSLAPAESIEVEFVARNVGRALLQSSHHLYRDFGLMARPSRA